MLGAGADEGIAGAQHGLAGGEVDGMHGGAAEAVHRGAADRQRQVGLQRHEPCHVEALLAFRKRATQDQVLDLVGIDSGARHQRTHDVGDEVVGPHPGQRALLRQRER